MTSGCLAGAVRWIQPLLGVVIGLGVMSVGSAGCAVQSPNDEGVVATSEDLLGSNVIEEAHPETAPIFEAVESGDDPPIPTTFCIDWAPYRVSGTARFNTGEVVDGALIQVYKNGTIASWNLIGSGYTAPDGSYFITVGDQPTYVTYNYPIGGSYSAYATREQCNGQPLTYSWTRSFQAGYPSGYLMGRVTLDGSNPPAGSKVVWSGATTGQVATAADGTYKTTNLFNGTYTVTAWAGNVVSSTETMTITTNQNTKNWLLATPPLSVSVSKSGTTLTATASGGRAGYAYSWSYYSRCAGGELELTTPDHGVGEKSHGSVSNLWASTEPTNLEPCGYWWGPYQQSPTNQFPYHSCNCRTYRVTVTDSVGTQAVGFYY